MKPADAPYRRLPAAAGLITRRRLWLGSDHLLLVSSSVLTQQYRRFYLHEIQSLSIAEIENPARFYGLVLSIMAVVFTFVLAAAGHPFWAVPCGLATTWLAVFTLTRPTVRCTLQTRIGTHQLPLRQLDTSRKVISIIKSEIDRVQGQLPPDWVAAHPHVDGAIVPPPLHTYHGGMHFATFAAMLAVALLTPLRLNAQSAGVANTLAATHIGMVILAIIAAVRQHDSTISRAARVIIGITLAWAAASFLTEQVIVAASIQAAFQNPMSFEYWRDPVWDVAIANAIAYTILGVTGTLALLSQRTARPA